MTTLQGDCRLLLPFIETASIDAVVTDPPYGLKFMGKGWDHGVPGAEFWTETARTMRPGAFLLAFGGTRTYHRLAVAIEDGGFEILDTLCWLYGSGFPKGKTRLKPAWEPITLARAPGPTRPLQIDDCRIPTSDQLGGGDQSAATKQRTEGWDRPWMRDPDAKAAHAGRVNANVAHAEDLGRWPANVVLDEDAAEQLDEQTGERKSGIAVRRNGNAGRGSFPVKIAPGSTNAGYGDAGGAARFFYCAKASRTERNAGLEGMPERRQWAEKRSQPYSMSIHEHDGRPPTMTANHHPTVKPIALMRWLVRLITPPGGLVLDPFAGSGTTGIAAALEGREYTGIEQDPEYVEIAERRIAYWSARPRALELAL